MLNESRKIKVALVLETSTVMGGAERRLIRIFSKIEGADILVCSLESVQKVRKTLTKYSDNKHGCIICYDRMSDVIKKLWIDNYDYVVYTNSCGTMLPVPFVAALSGIKRLWLLVNVDMSNWSFSNLKDRIIFNIFKLFATRVDCLYPSKIVKLQNKMSKKVRVTATPLPFTDLNIFLPRKKENTFIFASRLIEGKGALEFIDALILCKSEMRKLNYRAIVCGEGKLKNKIIKLIELNRVEDLVEVKGYCEMEYITPYAKVFMSLQQKENYPSQSLLEAISCGCWCIATDVGETKSLVKTEFGDLVNGTGSDISKAMIRAMEKTEEEYKKIKTNARKFAEANFNIQSSIDYFVEIFNEKR